MYGTKSENILKELTLSHYCAIWGNDCLPPGGREGRLKARAEQGLQKLGDTYSPDGKHVSFDETVVNHNIVRSQFFRYVQLRDITRTQQNQSLSCPNLSRLEEMLVKDCQGRGLISTLNNEVVSESSETSANKLKAWRGLIGGYFH